MTPTGSRLAVLDPTAFADRVMAAIADMPLPTPTRSLAAAVRQGALRDGVSTILVAWHLATVRTWPVAPRVRARSFALVFAVAALLATGSLATAAAVRIVLPSGWEHERIIDRTGSGVMLPVGDPSSGAAPERSPSAEPSDTPRVDFPPAVTGGAVPTTEDDHAAHDRDGSHDGDGSDSGGDASTADPEESQATPEPDHVSVGAAPDQSAEPDPESHSGDAPAASSEPDPGSDSGSTSDGGITEPDH